jgi:hypothetical protein
MRDLSLPAAAAAAAAAAADRAVEEEVQKVRLKNIHLANALKKLEATIRWEAASCANEQLSSCCSRRFGY